MSLKDHLQRMWFLVNHQTVVTDELVDKIAECRTGSDGLPNDEWLARARRNIRVDDWHGRIQLIFEETQEGVPHWLDLHVHLRMPKRTSYSLRSSVEYPLFAKEDWQWACVQEGFDKLDRKSEVHGRWFLDHAKCPLQCLDVVFGLADTEARINKHLGMEPQSLVWPVLLYGPPLVERFGRQRLLDTPAARIEEWPDGSVMIQVAQNPFAPNVKELQKVADHLELKVDR